MSDAVFRPEDLEDGRRIQIRAFRLILPDKDPSKMGHFSAILIRGGRGGTGAPREPEKPQSG